MSETIGTQEEGRGERRASAGLVLPVIAYVSAFYVPYLFNGATTLAPSYQDESQWLLYHHFINASYARGFFPLWVPDLCCGMPFLAWSHSAALFPLDLIYAALAYGQGVWVSQWVLALIYSLGVFYLCRSLGASGWAVMLAVMVQTPIFIMNSLGNFAPDLRSGAFAPWLFLCVLGLITRRRFKFLAGFILANLLMYLGGQVELIGLGYEVVAVALIAGGIYYRRQWRLVLSAWVLFAAVFALSYLPAQVQALPTLELSHFSIRGEGLTYDYFKIWSTLSLGPLNWLPYLISGLVLVLLAAAITGARRSAALFLGVVSLGFCVCAIHDLLGVMWVIYHVPVLKDLLAHARIIFHAEIIIAVMIALGADRVMEERRGWIAWAGALSALGALAWLGVLARRPELLAAASEPNTRTAIEDLARAESAGMLIAAGLGIALIFHKRIEARWPGFARWAMIAMAAATYGFPVFYALPNNLLDPFKFPKEYVSFMEERQGLHRIQTIYAWDRWQDISIPLQAGILYGTRSADAYITVSVDRYTRFLNAIIPGTFREKDHKIADLEATKVFKEGAFISDQNIRFLNLMGIKYLAAEQRNLKFADHFFLAYPDSPLLVSGTGAWVERLTKMVNALGLPLEDGTTPVEIVPLLMPKDQLHLHGLASGTVMMQKGDLLSLHNWNEPPGKWWMVMTGSLASNDLTLEAAKYDSKRFYLPQIELARKGDRTTLLSLIIIPAKGAAGEDSIANPEIINTDKYFKTVLAGPGFNIFENPGAMPPAFLVSKAETVTREDALKKMMAPSFDPVTQAVAEGVPLPELRGGALAPGEGVRVERYTPERVELTAAAAAPRLLVLTDVYFPGWRAWVDGREQRILPTDYAFRGLPLDPGIHRIRMAYQPPSFRIGQWVSLSCLLSLVIAVITSRSGQGKQV